MSQEIWLKYGKIIKRNLDIKKKLNLKHYVKKPNTGNKKRRNIYVCGFSANLMLL